MLAVEGSVSSRTNGIDNTFTSSVNKSLPLLFPPTRPQKLS